MQTVISSLEMLRRVGQRFGPYLMLEILLPGGTLLALLLFLYRRSKLNTESNPPRAVVALRRAFVSIAEQVFVLQPNYLRPSRAFQPAAGAGAASHEPPGNRRYR